MAAENFVSVRARAVDPLAGLSHEAVDVPEWGGAKVIVRAPTPSDHLWHVNLIWAAAGVVPGEAQEAIQAKLGAAGVDYTRASAALLVRTLFEQSPEGVRRVFQDEDLDEVVPAYGPVHARLAAKAMELGNLLEGAETRAKKPSKSRRASSS